MTHLPHQFDTPFLTDGGIETTLIFQMGHDLPTALNETFTRAIRENADRARVKG